MISISTTKQRRIRLPKLSIIIPVYNSEKYIADCVMSILNQTITDLEIILVNDGSKDASAEICNQLKENHENIKVIHQNNQGLSNARINGLQIAEGEWISFVDNDDLLIPDAFEFLLQNACDNEVEIVGGERIDLDSRQILDFIPQQSETESYIFRGPESCSKLLENKRYHIITPLWGKIYKKSLLAQIDFQKNKRLCPTIYFEDILMTPIILYHAKKSVFINHTVYIHRERPESLSRCGKMGPFYYEQIYSNKILIQFFKQKQLKELYFHQIRNFGKYLLFLYYNLCTFDKKNPDFNRLRQTIKTEFNKIYHYLIHDTLIKTDYKVSYFIFYLSSSLWLYTVAPIYFCVLKKIAYILKRCEK